MNLETKVKHIIAKHLNIPEDQVHGDSSFVDDFGADSLDIVELVMAMEEEFEIEIPDDEAEKLLTVDQVIDYLKKRIE